jgi:hypothetical protein
VEEWDVLVCTSNYRRDICLIFHSHRKDNQNYLL